MPVPSPLSAPAIRWGVLGAGGIARRFATAVGEYTQSTVVAVGARSRESAEQFAAEFSVPRVHVGYEELVDDPQVDAIYVATPHSLHAEHATLAVRAGKAVLVEKPFTHTGVQARQLVDVVRQHGVFAMEAMKTRHMPHMAAIRDLIANGEIGEVTYVQADHAQVLTHVPRLGDPNLAGGALLDLGVYPVSFAMDILGRPRNVTASGRLTDRGVDVQASIVLDYESAQASLTTSFAAFGANQAVIAGTEGYIRVNGFFFNANSFEVHRSDGHSWTFDGTVPNGLQYEAAEVARCLDAGLLESPRMPLDDSIAVVETLDEVRRQLGVVYPGESV